MKKDYLTPKMEVSHRSLEVKNQKQNSKLTDKEYESIYYQAQVEALLNVVKIFAAEKSNRS